MVSTRTPKAARISVKIINAIHNQRGPGIKETALSLVSSVHVFYILQAVFCRKIVFLKSYNNRFFLIDVGLPSRAAI